MKQTQKVTGNILLFYAHDIGDEIRLHEVRDKGLVPVHDVSQSLYFKDYHVPLAFRLLEKKGGETLERTDAVLNKMHHFGVVSFCYKIPFDASLDQLKQKVIEVKERYDKQSDVDARSILKQINPAVTRPHFYNLKNDYFAIHVNPIEGKLSADEFRELYGGKIASLLRLELLSLSEYQQDDILSAVTGYYGQDFIIIDAEAAFIYDDEYFEAMEFFESANVQQLELQYFDRMLDKKLNYFYQQAPHKIPLSAYIPLVGRRVELPATRLARLRVDISVITERLEHSIKMTGDAYYSKLYYMLVDKLSLREWRDSLNRKLDIISDLQRVHQSHLDTIHEDMLTLVIIILIALEVVLALF
ncbi:hypothetical protein KKA53_04715 [Candidatus Dependentiae bacterium]|nr:hypothetical protein [Candidatus Dependentiae bacterium]